MVQTKQNAKRREKKIGTEILISPNKEKKRLSKAIALDILNKLTKSDSLNDKDDQLKESMKPQKLLVEKPSKRLKEERMMILMPKMTRAGVTWTNKTITKMISMILILNAFLTSLNLDFLTDNIQPYRADLKVIGMIYEHGNMDTTTKLIENYHKVYKEKGYKIINLSFSDSFYTYKDSKLAQTYRNRQLLSSFFISKKSNFSIKCSLINPKTERLSIIFRLSSITYILLNIFIAFLSIKNDSKTYIMKPITSVVHMLNYLFNLPLNPNINKLYLNPSTKQKIELEIREYRIIAFGLMRSFIWLSLAFGANAMKLVSKDLILTDKKIHECCTKKFYAYIALIQFDDLGELCEKFESEILVFVNNLAGIIYNTSDRYFAEANFVERDKFLIFWRLESDNYKQNFHHNSVNRNSSEVASLSVTTTAEKGVRLSFQIYPL
jgi:hypothetical protein